MKKMILLMGILVCLSRSGSCEANVVLPTTYLIAKCNICQYEYKTKKGSLSNIVDFITLLPLSSLAEKTCMNTFVKCPECGQKNWSIEYKIGMVMCK